MQVSHLLGKGKGKWWVCFLCCVLAHLIHLLCLDHLPMGCMIPPLVTSMPLAPAQHIRTCACVRACVRA